MFESRKLIIIQFALIEFHMKIYEESAETPTYYLCCILIILLFF